MIKNYFLAIFAVGFIIVGASGVTRSADAEEAGNSAAATAGQSKFSSNVAVLDLEAVVQKSVAGQGISAIIDQREKALQAQANEMKKGLKEQEQKLIADRKNNVDQKTFEAEKKKFEDDIKSSQKSLLAKSNELEKSKLSALKAIQQNIAKITADIADERRIQIVVDRKFVVIAQQELDITSEVLSRLNASVKSIPFN